MFLKNIMIIVDDLPRFQRTATHNTHKPQPLRQPKQFYLFDSLQDKTAIFKSMHSRVFTYEYDIHIYIYCIYMLIYIHYK